MDGKIIQITTDIDGKVLALTDTGKIYVTVEVRGVDYNFRWEEIPPVPYTVDRLENTIRVTKG